MVERAREPVTIGCLTGGGGGGSRSISGSGLSRRFLYGGPSSEGARFAYGTRKGLRNMSLVKWVFSVVGRRADVTSITCPF